MPVIRCKVQSSKTIAEFYENLKQRSPNFNELASAMLRLLEMVNQEFPSTVFYALTSHSNLILLSKDDYTSTPRFEVQFSEDKYHIIFLNSNDERRLSNANLETVTSFISEMIKAFGNTAFQRSE